MILKLCFAAILISACQTASAQSLFVGNAGEGYIQDDQIYLRDLFDSNRHLSTEFGKTISPEISRRLHEWFSQDPDRPLRLLDLDMDLFARKLTDLNRRHPNLGFYVLSAFSLHRWHRAERPESAAQFENGYVILARRYVGLVNVEGWAWDRMTPAHRIALVIHEMIASFQKLDCRPDPHGPLPLCDKNEKVLRHLVAQLFAPTTDRQANLDDQLKAALEIPQDPSEMPRTPEETFDRIDRLCQRTPHHFTLLMERSPYIVRKETYLHFYRQRFAYRDMTLRFEASASRREVRVTPVTFRNDRTTCWLRLNQLYFDWLTGGP